jgi:hypothetical protein
MRPFRYSINVTLDGCCDQRATIPDEELHRHAVENLDRADALLFARVTFGNRETRNADCGMWNTALGTAQGRRARRTRRAVRSRGRRSIDAEFLRGDVERPMGMGGEEKVVHRLPEPFPQIQKTTKSNLRNLWMKNSKRRVGLIDEYQFVVHRRIAGHGSRLFDRRPGRIATISTLRLHR